MFAQMLFILNNRAPHHFSMLICVLVPGIHINIDVGSPPSGALSCFKDNETERTFVDVKQQ